MPHNKATSYKFGVVGRSAQPGFTLIELLIYMALVALLIGGTIGVVFDLISGQRNLDQNILNDSEAIFLIAKIDWALSGVTPISVAGDLLQVDKDGETIEITLDGMDMTLKRGAGSPVILNNSWTAITNLDFLLEQDVPTGTDSVTATFDLNGKTYQTRRLISR